MTDRPVNAEVLAAAAERDKAWSDLRPPNRQELAALRKRGGSREGYFDAAADRHALLITLDDYRANMQRLAEANEAYGREIDRLSRTDPRLDALLAAARDLVADLYTKLPDHGVRVATRSHPSVQALRDALAAFEEKA